MIGHTIASCHVYTTPDIILGALRCAVLCGCRLQAGLFVEAGVRKVRLTGGEPTLRPDLHQLCAQLAALPGLQTLAMTTNGITLSRQLAELRAAGE
jgi:pyruvate-formate lyase-activating enzyme